MRHPPQRPPGLGPGTVLCIGSGTHLHRTGPTIYAQDWITCITRLGSKFPGIRICPLTPIPNVDCPPSLASDLAMLACWFARMYNSGTLGLLDCWAGLAQRLAALPTTGEVSAPTFRAIAMPSSLSKNAALTTFRFVETSLRRVSNTPLDGKATDELVRALLMVLSSTLMLDCSPGESPVRTLTAKEPAKDTLTTVCVVGASNMRRCIPFYRAMGLEVIDLTSMGWDGSEEVARRVIASLRELSEKDGIVYVLDIFTATSYRFKQSDGGLALPIKIGGKYHLLGDLAICEDKSFKATIAKNMPVLEAVGGPMVIIPPLPRFMGGGGAARNAATLQTVGPAHMAISFLRKLRT